MNGVDCWTVAMWIAGVSLGFGLLCLLIGVSLEWFVAPEESRVIGKPKFLEGKGPVGQVGAKPTGEVSGKVETDLSVKDKLQKVNDEIANKIQEKRHFESKMKRADIRQRMGWGYLAVNKDSPNWGTAYLEICNTLKQYGVEFHGLERDELNEDVRRNASQRG